MFENFPNKLLDDPDFKEDSVREVIIAPMLTRLGYAAHGEFRVIRSKSLDHPFIYAGTRTHPIKMIPDYTLMNGNRALLILDAKSPSEDVRRREHIQQAYSYAIHPEIKSRYFALCNGKMLCVFDVDHTMPLLSVSFSEYDSRWQEIEKHLAPRYLQEPYLRKFKPDLGLAMQRAGISSFTKVVMIGVLLNTFARVNKKTFTASVNCEFAQETHCASFDFRPLLLNRMISGIPKELAKQFRDALYRYPFQACADMSIEVDLELKLGEPINGKSEIFRPFHIEKVLASRFNHSPSMPLSDDIPEEVFRLSKAYKMESSD